MWRRQLSILRILVSLLIIWDDRNVNAFVSRCLLETITPARSSDTFSRRNFFERLAISPNSLVDGDVVEFILRHDSGRAIRTLGAVSSRNKLTALCRRQVDVELEAMEGETAEVFLYYNEDVSEISLAAVEIVQVIEDALYSQRVIEDRISNPHGEHAEDVFIIRRNILIGLPDAVNIPVLDQSH